MSITLEFLSSMTGRRRVLIIAQGPQAERRASVDRLFGGRAPVRRSAGNDDEDRFDLQYHANVEGNNGKGPPSGDLLDGLFQLEDAVVGAEGQLLATTLERDHLRIDLVMEEQIDRSGISDVVQARGHALELLSKGPVTLDVRILSRKLSEVLDQTGLRLVEVETARVAIALGYYENPRRSTMEEIGEVLGISKSAVFYRLNGLERKAVQRLIELSSAQTAPESPPR